jgi:hypothetical protein
MTPALGSNLVALGMIVREFGLRPLLPALLACEALAGESGLLDVAVCRIGDPGNFVTTT